MYPAHTQLVAKWSSPSIGDQRATGCDTLTDLLTAQNQEMLEHLTNHFAPLPKLQAFYFTRYDIVARMETFLEDSEYVIHRYFSIKYHKGFDFIGLLDY